MPVQGTFTPVGTPSSPGGTAANAATPSQSTVKFGSNVAPAVEPPPPVVEEKAPEPVKEVESWRLAALSQKEKSIREQATAAKAERAAAAADRAAIVQAQREWQEKQAQYRQNPMLLLQEHGYDYDSVTRYVAQGGWSAEEQQAAQLARQQAQIQALAQARQEDQRSAQAQREADQRATQEAQAAARKAAEESAVTEFKGELKAFVKAEPDNYEMIGLAGENAMEMIYNRIEEHYQKTGQRLSDKDAADSVEKDLVEEAEKVIAASKKLQRRFAPTPPPLPQVPANRTLTNAGLASRR
jgi:hypothetical protein